MTEDEAKTKWCPFVRAVTGTIADDGKSNHNNVQPAINRIVDDTKWAFPKGGACIGPVCMAWRWDGPAGIIDGVETVVVDLGDGRQGPQARNKTVPNPKRDGHCGLAGAVT